MIASTSSSREPWIVPSSLLGLHQAERVPQLALRGHAAHALGEQLLGVGQPCPRGIELRQVGARRREVGVDAQRGEVFGLGALGPAGLLVDHAEVQARARHVERDLLRRDVLGERSVEGATRRGVERRRVDAGEDPRRRRADGADRVAQQRRERLDARRGVDVFEAVGGGGAHLGVGVARRGDALGLVPGRIASQRRERGRAHDRRLLRVGDELRQRRAGARLARRGGRHHAAEVRLGAAPRRAVPAFDGRRRPARGLAGVAVRAGVGGAGRRRQIGARHAHAVIGPRVHLHVVAARHVAGDALRAGAARLVEVVRWRVVGASRRREARVRRLRVALQAHRVAVTLEPARVRVVAVGAAYAVRIHPALAERAVDVDLIELLAVGVVQARRQAHGQVVVEQRFAGHRRRRQFGAPRMAGCADRDLARRAGRAEVQRQAVAGRRARRRPRRRGGGRRLRPRDVPLAGTVARLATHVGLLPARGEAVGRGVVALLVAGRVAGDAHRVGGLVVAGPVHHVAGRRLLVRVEVEPALLVHVPGDRQRLQPAAVGLDQDLLQRIDAERVPDLEVRHPAVGPVGVDEVLAVAAKEARRHALVREARVVEVAAHRLRRRRRHRHEVVRLAPRLAGLAVAADAELVVDVGRARRRGGARRGRGCSDCNRVAIARRGAALQPVDPQCHGERPERRQRPPRPPGRRRGRRWRRRSGRGQCRSGGRRRTTGLACALLLPAHARPRSITPRSAAAPSRCPRPPCPCARAGRRARQARRP